MVREVEKPGSDVMQYITELNTMLGTQLESIVGLKKQLSAFSSRLSEEHQLYSQLEAQHKEITTPPVALGQENLLTSDLDAAIAG